MIAPGSLTGLALYLAVLTASLVGSLHCAGMCGPFVAVYSAGEGSQGRGAAWSAHLAYHLGRGATYVLLGALGGALGSAIDWAGEASGFVHVATLVSSLLVILWGVSALLPRFRVRSPLTRHFGRALVQLGKKPRVFRASALGVFTPLLPCGWLYAFVVTAAGTGSMLGGASLMLVFWLGTVPALLGLGAVLNRVGQSLRDRIPQITGVALIVIGLFGVLARAQHALPNVHAESGEVVPCH